MTNEEKAKDKIKQLKEAVNLLDDIGFRISWALDFSEFQSINDILYPLSYQISEAQDEMEELLETMEEKFEEYEYEKAMSQDQFEKESELQYYVS